MGLLLVLVVREIRYCLVEKIDDCLHHFVNRTAWLLHLLDRRSGIYILRNENNRTVTAHELKVILRF